MRAVFRRELVSLFSGPAGYAVVAGFLVFSSGWFFLVEGFFRNGIASLRGYYGTMPMVFVFLVPAVTMRMWAEERRAGTDEILFSLPLGNHALVMGKFFAGLAVIAVALAATVLVPLSVAGMGDFERGELFSQYVGLLLLAVAAVGTGQLVSLLTSNQIAAYIVTVLVLFGFMFVGAAAAATALPDRLVDIARFFALADRYESFARGLIDTGDAAFLLGAGALSLLGSARVIEKRRAGAIR